MAKDFKEDESELKTRLLVEAIEAKSIKLREQYSPDAVQLLQKLEEHVQEKSGNELAPEDQNENFVSLENILEDSAGPIPLDRAISLMLKICKHLEARVVSHGSLTSKIFDFLDGEAFIDDLRGGWLDSLNAYKAPEAVKGESDHRVDVFSLGVIFYEMLTNKRACPVQDEKEKFLLSEIQLMRSPAWKELPAEIREIILKCMKKSPTSRYKSAGELQKALLHAGVDKPSPLLFTWISKPMAAIAATIVIGLAATNMLIPRYATPVYVTTPAASWDEAPDLDRIVDHNETPLSEKELAGLAKFNVVVLLDRSSSMKSPDCASNNAKSNIANGRSRWDWTANELENLSKQSSKIMPAGFDVITWNTRSELFRNCNSEQIGEIYKKHPPMGGTELGCALAEAFQLKFPTQKPMLLAIVTDGGLSDLSGSESAIEQKVGGEKAGQTEVVFLKVGGNNASGEAMLDRIEADFKRRLPTDHVVHTVSFSKFAEQGLGRSLANAANED